MKANELRIGNYVCFSIEHASSPFKIEAKDFGEDLENIDFIPLDETWLKKFGFEEDNNNLFFRIGKSTGWYLSNQNELTKSMGEHFVRIEYVHQLQNLYFVLTGEELKIT